VTKVTKVVVSLRSGKFDNPEKIFNFSHFRSL
jgi:hypothetical protein